MKRLLLALLLINTAAFSQSIPNAGFETWSASGPFLAPNGWGVSPGVKQSTDAHSGSYAMLCVVDTATNPMTSALDTLPGIAYTGAQSMTPPTPGSNVGGFAITSVPDSLTGYFKFRSPGNDTLLITASLYKWDAAAGSRHITGTATFTSSITDTAYSRFSVPLVDTSASLPDSAIIIIAAANPQGKGHLGTSLWVDDLAFTMTTTTLAQVVNITSQPILYPNPFTHQINLETHGTPIKHITLFNMAGQTVRSTTATTINTSLLQAGSYFVEMEDADGNRYTEKVVKE